MAEQRMKVRDKKVQKMTKDGLMCRLTPEDICDKIIRMMEDEELRMKCGRRAARKNFPGENDVEKLFCMMQSE